MPIAGLLASALRVAGLSLMGGICGWLASGAIFPRGSTFRAERLGWSFAIGCGLISAMIPAALLVRVRPGWLSFGMLALLALGVGRAFKAPSVALPIAASPGLREEKGKSWIRRLLTALIGVGAALYALRALTEPMWSNDFLAIWGLKGKTIFGAGTLPRDFYSSTNLEFSHPEYPLGLPLLFAGIAFLLGRWDDQAMAVLFPATLAATLLVLAGWIRRRGGSPPIALLAATVVAFYEPLYSGFLTGLADVPLAFGLLAFGTALSDVLDESDPRAPRRLALASALVAAIKNEGLFLAGAGAVIALATTRGRARWRLSLLTLGPALLVRALHFPWRSRIPLADFEFSAFSRSSLWDSLAAAARVPGAIAWLGIGLALLLIALGSPSPAGDRLLVLCGCALVAYLVLPAFAVRGAGWLVETTLRRTVSALIPLAAAATAVRFAGESSGFGTGPAASPGSP